LSLFLNDCLPIPENAKLAGTVSTLFAGFNSHPSSAMTIHQQILNINNNNNNNNTHHRRYGNNNSNRRDKQNINSGGAAAAAANPIVYVLHKDRWRCPSSTDCAIRLCRYVFQRRGEGVYQNKNPSSNGNSNNASPHPYPFPPVFIDAVDVAASRMRLIPSSNGDPKPVEIEDSTMTLFYNADQTMLPPHTVVPLGAVHL
jgi:hypothetical protein